MQNFSWILIPILMLIINPQRSHSFDCSNPPKLGFVEFLVKTDVVFIGEEVSRETEYIGDLFHITATYKVIEPLKGVSGTAEELAVLIGMGGYPYFKEDKPQPLSYLKNKTDLGEDSYQLIIARYGRTDEKTGERPLRSMKAAPCTEYSFSKEEIIALLKSWPYQNRHAILAAMLLLVFGAIYFTRRRFKKRTV